MTKLHLQAAALVILALLAGAILLLIAYVFAAGVEHATPDGKVPIADAGFFAALLLSFREVCAMINRLWDSAERSELTAAVSNSVPTASPNPPTEQPGTQP